ncbi:YdcF family protein [Oscillatoria amoena NRMC-F 0135]|nr:YdcF family protein [Oscillatoria amoena NRMC-F 0135]
MFFVLSKTLGYLVMPLVVVCMLFLISVWVKSADLKKRIFWIAFGALYLFSNEFIANEVMMRWEIAPTPYAQINTSYPYGVVLTGVTINDATLTDRVFFQHGADRVIHAADLFKRGIIRKIIVSGGTGRLITESRREADDLGRALVLMGVPADSIILENESRNTHESAVNVKEILKDHDDAEILLITSGFHMRRSVACFRKAGLMPTLFSTDFYTHPRYYTVDVLFIPKAEALLIWHKLAKEWTGFGAYWIMGYL